MADTKPKSSTKYTAPALEKGLDVLEFLSTSAEGENLSRIAKGLGRSSSEIFRMLAVLEARKIIRRDGDTEKFSLTDKLFQLGLNQPIRRQIIVIARPLMERFASEYGLNCHISVSAEDAIVVIFRVESAAQFSVSVRVGHKRSKIGSPSGHCSLVFASDAELEAVFRRTKNRSKNWTKGRLLQDLELIRSNGYCIIEDNFVHGIIGVAAPIVDPVSHKFLGAITAPVAKFVGEDVVDIIKIAEALRQCAQKISLG